MTKNRKLNDLQLILLSTAAQREEGSLLPLPEAASAKPDVGRKAVEGLVRCGFAEEVEVEQRDQVWRDEADRRIGLRITEAGLAAMTGGTAEGAVRDTAPDGSDAGSAAAEPRTGSKQALLLDLVGRPNGATIDELVSATGWLPHTTRAAITGLRKRGHVVLNDRRDGISRYHMGQAQS